MDGLNAQMNKDLELIPFDITGQADQLSNFLTNQRNPLMPGGVKQPAAQVQKPGLQAEGVHGAAPSSMVGHDVEKGGRTAAELLPVVCHQAPPAGGATLPKMKELFNLAQKGGFEKLTSFAAANTTEKGGQAKIAKKLREQLAQQFN